jgi:type I restriction enzyme S subunit
MSDWHEASLADLAEYINGRAIKPEECSAGPGMPVIRIKQINDPQTIDDCFCGDNLDEKNIVRNGDLLFSWSATLKTILWQGPAGAINQHIFKVIPRPGIDKTFLHYLIDNSIPALTEESHGSTMKHIKKSALSAFHLQIPPLPEQKKIAEILSGIDKRITASDNLQKYYLLLLDSVSRDSFKIEAGEIKTLGELAEFKSGRAFKSEELSEDGIKITRISNLHKPNFPYWRYNGEYNPKIVAKDGDILFSWAGVANSINVHRYRGEDSLLNQHIYNFEFDDTLIKEWSYWNLRNMLPKLRESIEGGAGQLHLAKGFIQSLPIPILSRSKMDSLSKCFQSIQTLVEAQKKTSIKLLTLKNALLSDLFSGRKRVSV